MRIVAHVIIKVALLSRTTHICHYNYKIPPLDSILGQSSPAPSLKHIFCNSRVNIIIPPTLMLLTRSLSFRIPYTFLFSLLHVHMHATCPVLIVLDTVILTMCGAECAL